MKVRVLASGSKGNSTLIKTDKVNILIDIGINYQYLFNELEKSNISPKEINSVILTHTHNDHVKGLASLIKKTNMNVYILKEMEEEIIKKVPRENIRYYTNPLYIEDLKISLIRISHDVEGVGFIIENNDKSLVYITDTGYINEKYFPLMKNKNLYIIESNHDEEMLMEGPYPYILKQRVISDHGHLSNITTASYLKEIVGDKTKKIILAHISEKNNTKELAIETTREVIKDKEIIAAEQYTSLEEIEV